MTTHWTKSLALAAVHLLACGVAAATFSCAEDELAPGRVHPGAAASDGDGGGTASEAKPANLAPLRRLTAFEYTNSVRDLFPGITLPALTFPPETPANGFVNNAAVQNPSAILIEAYQRAAGAVAAAVVASDKAPCKDTEPTMCMPGYIGEFGGRLFRRPLVDSERKAFTDFFAKMLTSTSANVATQLTLAAMLQSPQFLYRIEAGRPGPGGDKMTARRLTDHETATRLSYLFWSSTPDDTLLAAAAKGELGTPTQIEAQARRLLLDPRARAAVVNFHEQWLDFQRLASTQKNTADFPTWNDGLRAAMKQEGRLFVEKTIFEGEGTVHALLTSANTWVNPALADLYGVAPPAPAAELGDFGSVTLDAAHRGGFLTMPFFLASQAHQEYGSPVLRGKFILERLFCTPPPAPPPNVNVTPPVAGGSAPKTNRQRYSVHSENPNCAGCHKRMDALGFPFESFDTLGRFRTTDNGEPVDTSGVLDGSGETDGPVKDALELSQRLSASSVVKRCVTTEWFRDAYGRSEFEATDGAMLTEVTKAFSDGGGNVRELLIAIVKHPAFTTLPGSTP